MIRQVRELTVEPRADGWALKVDEDLGETTFRSGAAAETAARRLAEGLSREGSPVKLTVWLRDGSIAGRFLIPPASGSVLPNAA